MVCLHSPVPGRYIIYRRNHGPEPPPGPAQCRPGGEIYPGPPAGAAGLLGALPRPAGGSAPGAGHQSLAQGGKIGPLPSDGKFVNLWEDFFH